MISVPRASREIVPFPHDVLVVEDEDLTRSELSRALERKGFQVRQVSTGACAIAEAGSGGVGVVLMDIVLNEDEKDGVEAAVEIQRANPNTSVIFLSAYAKDPHFREKAQKGRLRVGDWVDKPIDLSKLIDLIAKEMWKVQIRTWLDRARRLGKNPEDELSEIRGSHPDVPPQVIREILQELRASQQLKGKSSRVGPTEEPNMETVSAEIDRMYARIREVVASQPVQPELSRAIRPLRRELRRLQMMQADAMESYFLSQLKFDPEAGHGLVQRAEKLLKKR